MIDSQERIRSIHTQSMSEWAESFTGSGQGIYFLEREE